MANLIDFIQIYDGALEADICDFLIDFFENNQNLHERLENDKKPNCTQVNLTSNSNITENIKNVHNHLIKKAFEYRNQYYNFTDDRVFPSQHAFEQFKIKKYNNDGVDGFNAHVDVDNYENSRRYLAFFWYLNDVDGGEIQFKDLIIPPKKGRLVVFPPLWLFPYKELDARNNPKYITTTYLHYK